MTAGSSPDTGTERPGLGIEVVGQMEFSIRELLKAVPVQATDEILDRTRYISAKLQAA